jgi:hypothetical protein
LYDIAYLLLADKVAGVSHTGNFVRPKEVTVFRTSSSLANERVTVRHAHVGDETAIAKLAALDSAHTPAGSVLVAESDARILAALPLGSGRPIADPFVPTAELVALLQLRAAQLDGMEVQPGRIRRLVRGLFRARPATA